MSFLTRILVLGLLGFVSAEENQPLAGCSVIRIPVLSREQKNQLTKIFQITSSNTTGVIEFWTPPHLSTDMATLVTVCQNTPFEKQLANANLPYEIFINDLHQYVEDDKKHLRSVPNSRIRQSPKDLRMGTYHTLATIYEFLLGIQEDRPDIVTVTEIGKGSSGIIPIKLVKVGEPSEDKPAVWINCGVHGNEWLSHSTCIWLIHRLIYSDDSTTRELVKHYDWYILPIANPDGYHHTWLVDRLWRKNLGVSSSFCLGVDLDRNFAQVAPSATVVNLGDLFVGNLCTAHYRGPFAFSEKETQYIRNQLMSLKPNLKIAFSLNAYSQRWMFPYAYSKTNSMDHEELMKVSYFATKAIKEVHGTTYTIGSAANVLHPYTGSELDWVHYDLNVKYTFMVQMRDKGQHGYLLPANQIIPNAAELWEGIKYVAVHVSNSTA